MGGLIRQSHIPQAIVHLTNELTSVFVAPKLHTLMGSNDIGYLENENAEVVLGQPNKIIAFPFNYSSDT